MFVSKEVRLIVSGFSICLLSGCMDIRAVDREKKEQRPTAIQQSVVSVPWKIRSTGQFNSYQVVFENIQGHTLLVERETIEAASQGLPNKSVPLHLGVTGGQSIDVMVEGGKNYHYHFLDPRTGERLPEKSFVVKVPLDIKVETEVTPQSELGKIFFAPEAARPLFGRLWFSSKALITTQGQELRLEAHLIEAESVLVIRAFNSDEQAKTTTDRVHGGVISISANQAIGEFKFDISGRQGLTGAAGRKPGPELKGAPGPQGKAGRSNYSLNNPHCYEQPGAGGAGFKGDTGYSGEPGEAGGDTVKLTLRIEDRSEFRRTIIGTPGRGGEGGLGGEGGEGGDGGRPGKAGFPCSAKSGARGERGERGRQGDWGPAGKFSPIYEWIDGKFEEMKNGDWR